MQPTIQSLYSYPVKSCAGIAHQKVRLSESGLAHDRHWVIVDDQGVFMTQRQHPRMVLIQPAPQDDGLWLRAAGQEDCFVPLPAGDAPAIALEIFGSPTLGADQGAQVARWLSTFLGVGCRLLHLHPQAQRVARPPYVQRWIRAHADWPQSFLPVARHVFGFADGFPFLVTSQSSLDDLNRQLQTSGAATSDMRRFRPNIVLQGLEPWDEDHLAGFRTGGAGFAFVKACARCSIPNVDPRTAQTAAEPGRTLARLRQFDQGVLFGTNAIASLPAGEIWLQVGDVIEAEYDF